MDERTKDAISVAFISVLMTLAICIIIGSNADLIVDFLTKYISLP